MMEDHKIPVIEVKQTISGSNSHVEVSGKARKNARVIRLECLIVYEDMKYTKEIESELLRSAKPIFSLIDFSMAGYNTQVIDFSVESGSIRIRVAAIIVACFNIAANYDSLKSNIPVVIEDISRLSKSIIDNAKDERSGDTTTPKPSTPPIPAPPKLRPLKRRSTMINEP